MMPSSCAIRPRYPALTPQLDFSKALYYDPPSHDFLVWIIAAELMRRRHAPNERLKVQLLLNDGQLGLWDTPPSSLWSCMKQPDLRNPQNGSRAYSDKMIEHVIQPAIDMIGAERLPDIEYPVEPDDLYGFVEYDYHLYTLVDAARWGCHIPRWWVPVHDFDHPVSRRYITITLRETSAQPERNSQLEEWIRFAEYAQQFVGVIFIRDTATNGELIEGFVTSPEASLDAYFRVALYNKAALNLFVCNGPFTWAMCSDTPYLLFKQLVPALPDWDHGQPKGWIEQDHLEVGDQLPWASPLQRFTWKDDTFENIKEEFDKIWPKLT